jgi:3-methyladenine DNA glycosylase AlkD
MAEVGSIVSELRRQSNPANIAGQQRFGIRPRTEQLGLAMSPLRELAKAHRRDHSLALELWAQPIYECRLLAALVADPKQVTPELMDAWIVDFDSWALCDNTCLHLFRRTPHGFAKVSAWADRTPEFERRAAFALLAALAVHAKREPDQTFLNLLPLIERAADDDRNFVKKAVNWALRQIGKRNSPVCHAAAMALAADLAERTSPASRWIGKDALRELRAFRDNRPNPDQNTERA